MVFFILLVLTPSSADLLSNLEDTTISMYFLISRGIVLYSLVMWYMFMYFMVLNSYDATIEKSEYLTSQPNLIVHNEVQENPIIRPSAPSIIPEVNNYPSLDEYDYGEDAYVQIVLRQNQG